MTIRLFAILWVALVCSNCSKETKRSLIFERLKPSASGELDSTVLCGTLSVFENRQTNSGRKIELKVVVIPAIHRDKSALPVFCFEGGPGVSATVGASFYADTINYYRLRHDVVLIDSRGTGGSNPLHCRQLQYKAGLEQQFSEMYPIHAVNDCYDSLSKLADLTQYTTSNMAMDAEEVRRWLGYDKINIFGLSFGGRLAQVYLKMFPNSVESCVLWSPAAINSRMPLDHARYADEGLNKLFDDCKNDSLCNSSFPAIREEFQTLMETGKQKPFDYKIKSQDGKEELIAIPWYSFHTKLRSMMYAPMSSRQIPFIVHQSFLGNWRPFISLYPKGGSYNDFIAEGLYLCVTCAEDVPFITKKETDSLTANTSMGDYRIQQQKNACGQWAKGNIPDNFMEPVSSAVPTLLISGYFDPVTPPSMAKEIAQTLPNCFLVSIPTMSHTFDGLSNPECFDKLVVDFLDQPNTKPNAECILQMLPDAYKTKE